MMSAKRSGFILIKRSRMPADSSWKTPFGLAALQELEGLGVVERKVVEVDRGRRDAAR